MKTLQTQYNLIKEGKGDKAYFMKLACYNFPDLVTPVLSYNDTITVLKNKSILSEGIGGVVTTGKKQDWHAIFNENMTNLKEEKEAKAEEKETTKEVTDMAIRGYDYKDTKNYDNVFGQEFLKGFYTEMQDPKNEDKTVEELRAIVAKNLAKDLSHYVKDGQFGIKGVGYTTETPGLGTPKEAKGKHKSSGYGDLKESVLRSQIYLLVKEVLSETKFEVGDNVTYKGDKYKITRFVDDRIYIKSLKQGGRPDSWVKASDLKKGVGEGIHDKDITSAPHTNVKGKMGDYDPKARAASLARLANFGPKSKPENIDETSEAKFEEATDMIDAGESVENVAKMFPNIDKAQLQQYKETKDRLETGDLD